MTLRVGFVGGGGITETHARAVRDCPDLTIAAFCGSNTEKTTALAAEHGAEAFAHAGRDGVVVDQREGTGSARRSEIGQRPAARANRRRETAAPRGVEALEHVGRVASAPIGPQREEVVVRSRRDDGAR